MKSCRLIVTLATALCLSALHADIQPVGPGLFAAGIKSNEFAFFAARQNKPNWCWAACVQMVLNYHGLMVTQEAVLQRVFGAQIDVPGQPQHILTALSGWAPNMGGGFSAIQASPYVFQGSQIVQDLAWKYPLIVGLKPRTGSGTGHAYVLTAVVYGVNPSNNEPIFQGVILRDPWPTSPSRQEMSWAEFQNRVMFWARVHVQRMQ